MSYVQNQLHKFKQNKGGTEKYFALRVDTAYYELVKASTVGYTGKGALAIRNWNLTCTCIKHFYGRHRPKFANHFRISKR